MSKAVVLLSGGMDSTVCATKAAQAYGPENVIALSLHYGQKHAVEIESAKAVAKFLGLGKYKEVQLPPIFTGAGSTLVDRDKDNPEMSYEELRRAVGPSPTYVPFRNGNLLSVATSLALVEGASVIYYGAHAEDARNFAYPDCTPEFNGAMANAIYVGTYYKVRLITPLQWLDKSEIVQEALRVKAPLHLTHSCYNGKKPACGKCPTCVEHIEAFKRAGFIDPIPYEIEVDWGDAVRWIKFFTPEL